jgi:hypothetical protein
VHLLLADTDFAGELPDRDAAHFGDASDAAAETLLLLSISHGVDAAAATSPHDSGT